MEEHYYIVFLGVRDQHNYDSIAQLYVAHVHVMKKQTRSCIGLTVNFTEDVELIGFNKVEEISKDEKLKQVTLKYT